MTNGAEAASAGRLRAVASRALLLIASLLLTALLVELSLHVVSFVMQAGGRETQRDWLTGDFRVLALGDSNTFGLFLAAHESYPGQLQASWNEDFATPKIEVVNLGYPSTNSSRLLLNFERLLEAFTPNVVLLQIGVNDYWTAPVPLDRESLAGSLVAGTVMASFSVEAFSVDGICRLTREAIDARRAQLESMIRI